MIYTAFGYDGSVRIKADMNHKNFDNGLSAMKKQVDKFGTTLKKLAGTIGVVFGTAAIVNFGKEAVKAASALNDAWMGLSSIVEGQGKSFSAAKSFINEYISDGLVPLENAVTAYKNLAARGYSTDQIEKTMTALKDAAAFGRQASYSLGDAVSTATEGLKNENSILVDNAGVTKNVAKMWEDYAKSIGTTAQNLTQEQKIQAEVNGILEETKFQTGDAAKLVNTYSGQIAMLGYNFQQLKVEVGNALIPVIQAVLPGINAIISALLKLAKVFSQVTALLFGKSTAGLSGQVSAQKEVAAAGSAAADSSDALKDSLADVGDAAKEAGKDMKSVTAPFDEFNILADRAAGAADNLAGNLDLSGADAGIPELDGGGELFADAEVSPKLLASIEALRKELEWLKELAGRIWDVFRQAWDKTGGKVIEAFQNALSSIWDLIKSISDAFANVWTNGTGLEILNTINRIISNILNIAAELADRFREAWEANGNGEAIWQAILDIVQTLLSFVERLTDATLEWAQELDLEPLVTSFRNLLEAINPLVEVITDGLAWAYENVLLPLGEWVAEELAPAALDLLTAAAEALTVALETLEPFATWLWENFLQPIAEWTGDLIIAGLQLLGENMNTLVPVIAGMVAAVTGFNAILDIATAAVNLFIFALAIDPIYLWVAAIGAIAGVVVAVIANWEELTQKYGDSLQPITDVIESIKSSLQEWFDAMKEGWETYIEPVLQNISKKFEEVVKEHVKPMIDQAVKLVGNISEVVKLLWDSVLSRFVSWMIQTMATKISSTLKTIGDIFNTTIKVISDLISGLLQILNGVIEFLVGAFTGDWEKAFTGIKDIVEGAISFVSGIIDGFIDVLKGAIDWLKDFLGFSDKASKAKAPSGYTNSSGGNVRTTVEVSRMASSQSKIALPRLANGAVIPPNQQFAAVLGDQRSGKNLEAPASLIKQMVIDGIREAGVSGGNNQPIQVNVMLDKRVLARAMVNEVNDMTRQAGRSVIDF